MGNCIIVLCWKILNITLRCVIKTNGIGDPNSFKDLEVVKVRSIHKNKYIQW